MLQHDYFSKMEYEKNFAGDHDVINWSKIGNTVLKTTHEVS